MRNASLAALCLLALAASSCDADEVVGLAPFPLPVTLAADKQAWLVDTREDVEVFVSPGQSMWVDYDPQLGRTFVRYSLEKDGVTYRPQPQPLPPEPPADEALIAMHGNKPRVLELQAQGLTQLEAVRQYWTERQAVYDGIDEVFFGTTETYEDPAEGRRAGARAVAEWLAASPLVASAQVEPGGTTVLLRWRGESEDTTIFLSSERASEEPFLPQTEQQARTFHELLVKQLEREGTRALFRLVDGSVAFTPITRELLEDPRLTRFRPPRETLR